MEKLPEKNIYTQLLLAQSDMPKIEYDSKNEHFKNKYASLPTVLGIVNPILNKHGIVHFSIQEDDKPDVLVITLFHTESQTCLKSYIKLINMSDMQKWSGSATHAERKGLLKMLGIDADMDDDGNSASTPIVSKPVYTRESDKSGDINQLTIDQLKDLKSSILSLWNLKKEVALDVTLDPQDFQKGERIESYIDNGFMKKDANNKLVPVPASDLIKIQNYLKEL